MPYTIGFTLFDLAGFYTAALPSLGAVLNDPSLGPPLSITSTTPPLTVFFAPAPNPPPGSSGTLLVTDPAGPGDFFRSGPLATWPAEPVSVIAGTGAGGLTFEQLTAGSPTPAIIDLRVAGIFVGLFTGFLFSPRLITISRMVLGPSPTAGIIQARFSGIIEFFTLFIPRRTDFTGTLDVTLTPSGDAADTGRVVIARTSNLSLSPGFLTPLSTLLVPLLAPAFSDALREGLTRGVNREIASMIGGLRATLPTLPGGGSLFSSAATLSARRITVGRGGITVQGVLSELRGGVRVTSVSRMAAAPLSDGRLEAWFVTNGRLFSTWQIGMSTVVNWAPWFDFLAYRPELSSAVRQVAMAPLPDGRLEAWAVTEDGGLFSTWKVDTAPDADWEPWFDFLADRGSLPAPARQVTMAPLSDGRLEAWVVTADGGVFSTWKVSTDPDADWAPWFDFIAYLGALPAPVRQVAMAPLLDGRLEAWAVTDDGGLFSTWKVSTDPDADWAPWFDFIAYLGVLPAPVRQVAVAPLSDGRLELWTVTMDGRLFSTWQVSTDPNSDWAPWFDFTASLGALPAPAQHVTLAPLSDGRLTAWVAVMNGGVFTTTTMSTDPDAAWTPWADFLVEV